MPLLSLSLGEHFLPASESVRTLPELLKTLTSPYTLSACIEFGRVMMRMMERLSLGVSAARIPGTVNLLRELFKLRVSILMLTRARMTWPWILCLATSHHTSSDYVPGLLDQYGRDGEWTMVTCYENGSKEPVKLRYAFATLDSAGQTLALGVPEFLRAHMSEDEAAETEANIARWEREATELTRKVDQDRERQAKLFAEHQVGWVNDSQDRPVDLSKTKLAVCGTSEVSEIFMALSNLGLLVSPLQQDGGVPVSTT